MIRPGVGELLEAIADVLEGEVLPAHPDGPGVEQLKVARGVLRRLAAVWDLVVPTIEEDSRDLERTLRQLAELLPIDARDGEGSRRADGAGAAGPYEAACSRNEALQSALLRAQVVLDAAAQNPEAERARAVLLDFYERSLRRDARLSGRASDD
ncbi:MAG: hypothetical protein HKP27_08460 [Myxococcales bacterium]|nr:hypothetical protein [Myxococcales bacterium]